MHVHANKDVRKVSKNTCIYTFGKVIHGDNSEKYASQENEATHSHFHVPGRKGLSPFIQGVLLLQTTPWFNI